MSPPIAAVLGTADYAAWPRNPLAADTEVLLPPAAMTAPFALAATTGFVLIVSGVGDLDDAAVAGVQARLAAALPAAGGDEQAVRAAVATLEADGFAVAWAPLRVQ